MIENDLELKPAWVDVDDFETLTKGLSIEIFPTIVILHGCDVLFFGSIDTKQGTLSTLVSGVSEHPPIAQYWELGKLIEKYLIR